MLYYYPMDTLYSALTIYALWQTACSLVTFVIYGVDKHQATVRGQRIPERTLHLLTILGGVGGAILGMIVFRHKKNKATFWAVIGVALIIHVWILNKFLPLNDLLREWLLEQNV